MLVALLKGSALKILRKDLFLKNFGYSQFSSSFHFEPLKFFDLVIEVKDHISLFQHLGIVFLDVQLSRFLLLFSSWNHHCLIRTINLKENSHFLPDSVLPLLSIFKPLVLIVRIFIVYQMIEDMTGIGHFETSPRFKCHLYIFRETCRQKHPDTVCIQLQRLPYPSFNIVATVTNDIGP